MEGETDASIAHQLSIFHERVLPTLDNNIKDGNSLVDTDFYATQLDFGEEKKIKPFNWLKSFPEVFSRKTEISEDDLKTIAQKAKQHASKALQYVTELEEKLNTAHEPTIKSYTKGGFDVVIGNPPYLGGREWKEENGNVYDFFISKYKVAEYQFDIYSLFWEAGINLLRENGLIGYITPNTWLNNQSNKKLRNYIIQNTSVKKIVDYSKIKVFEQATVLPIITILQNKIEKGNVTEIFEPVENRFVRTQTINQEIWNDGELNIFNINLSQGDLLLREKIEKRTLPLERFAIIKFGIKIYETGKGKPPQKANFPKSKVYESNCKIDATYRPYLEGKDIIPYSINYHDRWLKYGENLAAPRNPILFEGERILVRRIVGKTLISAYTNGDFVTSQLLQIVKPFDQSISKFLLGIINSRLMAYYFKKKFNRQDKIFPEIRIYELASLPIKQVDSTIKQVQIEIEKFVDQLLKLNEEKKDVMLPSRVSQIEGKIEYCEDKINDLVYQLYELTEDEINIVIGNEI